MTTLSVTPEIAASGGGGGGGVTSGQPGAGGATSVKINGDDTTFFGGAPDASGKAGGGGAGSGQDGGNAPWTAAVTAGGVGGDGYLPNLGLFAEDYWAIYKAGAGGGGGSGPTSSYYYGTTPGGSYDGGEGGGAGSSEAQTPGYLWFGGGGGGGGAGGNPDGGNGAAGGIIIRYVLPDSAAPTVSAVSPNLGPDTGGQMVTITGTGFAEGATVTFDDSALLDPVVVDDTTITATTPAGTVGTVDVTVTNPDTQSGTAVDGYTYGYSLTQSTGTVAPGGSVTYTTTAPGNNLAAFFVDGEYWGSGSVETTPNPFSWCFFGGAADVVGTYRVYAPDFEGDPGWESPYAATIDTKFTGSPTYSCDISAVSPSSGPLAGGGSVTITGGGFQEGATVEFGSNSATDVVVVDDTTITATVPAGAAGEVDVSVSNNPLSPPFTKPNGYTYVAASPTVSGVSPSSGRTAGGTGVIVTGTGFASGATVRFGPNSATGVTVVNATTITATTPAGAAGAVAVTVTNPDAQSGTLASGFTYTAPRPPDPTPEPSPSPTPSPTPTPTPTPSPVPVPVPSELKPGESALLVDGVPQEVRVDPKPSDNGLTVQGDGWSMDLDGLGPDGKPLNLGPDGVLLLQSEREVATSGTGFQSGSEVDLFVDPPVASPPLAAGASWLARAVVRAANGTYVGTVPVNAQGSFAGVATLPADIAPGDHVLQAVGFSPTGQTRALNLGVRVLPSLVLDQGVRKGDGRHDRIRTTGASTGIRAGAKLTPYIRYGAKGAFKKGVATIVVQADGSFTWTRQIRKDKAVTGYVTYTPAESNKVTWIKVKVR